MSENWAQSRDTTGGIRLGPVINPAMRIVEKQEANGLCSPSPLPKKKKKKCVRFLKTE
jgi:hypothetical protein